MEPMFEHSLGPDAPIARYFDCIERRDADGLREVFTADASGKWGTNGEVPLDGAEAIVRYLMSRTDEFSITFLARPPTLSATEDADVVTAKSRTVGMIAAGDKLAVVCAEYADLLRCEGGSWRIQRRDHVELWRAEAPLTMLSAGASIV